ncbi:MAG: glycosyltransferase [Chloroflexota bacterium]|nr:glycosyltransferase [Chloroflexota bacterium]|tara:strand:+ start:2935 stop:4125 length:1191 start_codon:yes stop_codon:yes gene_type:complete
MKIALISVHGDPVLQAGGKDAGGMNIYIREVAERLVGEGIDIDVFTRMHDRNDEIEESLISFNMVYVKAGKESLDKLEIFSHLDDFANEVDKYAQNNNKTYDLIYAHYWLSGVVALKLKKLWLKPVVTSFHTVQEIKQEAFPFNIDNPTRGKEERNVSKGSDAIVVWSDHEEKFIKEKFKINAGNIEIIPPGVDINVFKPEDRFKSREIINLNQDEKVILYVGRLERLKGLDILLEALSLLDQRDINLLVVGGLYNLEELSRLKKICNNLDLDRNVHFIGSINRRELKYYYNASDLCVLPSYYESFGLSALEASACGIPVIASKRGGLSSIVIDKKTGYLLQWRCPGPFVDKLEVLLSNRSLRDSMGMAARSHAMSLSWDNTISKLIDLFNKLTLS